MKFIKKIIKNLLGIFNLKITKINYGPIDFPVVEADSSEKKLLELSGKYSMTNLLKRWSLINAIKHTSIENVEGDFVECGVWKGGNLIIFEHLNEKYQMNKKIYAYDTFSGMSEPTTNDKNYLDIGAQKEWEENKKNNDINLSFNCYSSLEEVKNNLLKNSIRKNLNNLKFIKGKVEKTLQIKDNLPEKIAILRLDTDWYESTKKELEILFPRLSKNGILIIDDYGHWKGARKAVDEYFEDKDIVKHFIDFSCRMIIKTF